MPKHVTILQPEGGITFDSVDVRTAQRSDPVLTQIARQYRPSGFVADRVCPRITVQKESGRYIVFDKRAFFATDVDYKKPDRAPAKGIDLQETFESFTCEEYAVRVSISRRERENAEDQIRLEQSRINLAMDQLALAREVRVATLLQESGTTGGGLDDANESTPTNNWDVATGEIETDIVTAIEGVADDIGYPPNAIVIPWKVANAMAKQEDIREILKYTVNGQRILADGQQILPPTLWGLNVLIASPYKTTDKEGDTSVALTTVWGTDVRVLYVAPAAGYGTPSVAYTFQTRGVESRRWVDDNVPLEWIEVSEVVAEKVVAPEAGWEIKAVL